MLVWYPACYREWSTVKVSICYVCPTCWSSSTLSSAHVLKHCCFGTQLFRLQVNPVHPVGKCIFYHYNCLYHSWVVFLLRTAVIFCLASVSEAVLSFGGCGDCSIGKVLPALCLCLFKADIVDPDRLTSVVPLLADKLRGCFWCALVIMWGVTAFSGENDFCDTGRCPLAFFSSKSCSLAWVKASVSS